VIFLFDALAWGFEHVPFDAAFIAAVARAYPGEPIHFFAERDHLAQVQRFLGPGRRLPDVEWRELTLAPRFAAPKERVASDFRLCRSILSEARRLGATRVVACYMHATTGTAALKALSLVYRQMVIALVHHGSLLRLMSSRRFGPLLRLGNRRLRQIVLGEPIRAEVLADVPELRRSLRAIRHPYFFDGAAPSEYPGSAPATFSFLGLIDESKGFAEFVDLAGEIAPPAGDAVRFDLIGGKRGAAVESGPWVKLYGSDGPLPRDVFERQLGQTTYAVFPYRPSAYRLVASGSVLDALAAGKPLIALRNPQFEEMFQVMGDIGYLCDDMAGMKGLIASILRDPPRDRYRQQSRNILATRRIFEPAAVAVELRAALAP
jgi:glycosyltransferase involved in cell wall biosynthesis